MSLLLGLSEEVLVYLVKLARFTLTDVGHLRATCKRLCNFFDRIRSNVVNDSVVGDLSRYHPYGYWDIDLAAKNGHLEVIQLLHEDEAKRGRVTHCSNESIKYALRRRDYDTFVFLVCNRGEVFCEDALRYGWELEDRFADLSDAHVEAIMGSAPSFLRGVVSVHAADIALRAGDEALFGRVLANFDDPRLLQAAEVVACALDCDGDHTIRLLMSEWGRHSNTSEDDCVTRALLYGAIFSGKPAAVERAFALIPLRPAQIEASTMKALMQIACTRGSTVALERLRSVGGKCPVAFGTCVEEIERCVAEGADVLPWELMACLFRRDFGTAAYVRRAMQRREELVTLCVKLFRRAGALDVLQWMRAERLLSPDLWLQLLSNSTPQVSESDYRMDFIDRRVRADLLSRSSDEPVSLEMGKFILSLYDAGSYCETPVDLYRNAIRHGNTELLRFLCQRAFIRREYFGFGGRDEGRVARDGHYEIVAYMIDVNCGLVPLQDVEETTSLLHPVSYPFNLTNALDYAVKGGHLRLARMIDRRLPGLRASLRAAIISRRWRLWRWVLQRSHASAPQDLRSAFVAAVKHARMDFVRWFAALDQSWVVAWGADVAIALEKVRDMQFVRAFLSMYTTVPAHSRRLACVKNLSYETFLVERSVGWTLASPLSCRELASRNRRDILQAAIDFGLPLRRPRGPSALFEDTGRRPLGEPMNPSLYRWIKECHAAGKFKLVEAEEKETERDLEREEQDDESDRD